MNNTYTSLVNQTFHFPQEGFEVDDNGYLEFNGVDLKAIIEKHGTPLKLTYLPKIGMQIKKAKQMFAAAFKKHKYEGEYFYCYCTKSSHFSFIVEEALGHNVHLETSFAYDIDIINQLYKRRKINKEIFIICNGYKQKLYMSRISKLINTGFKNVIPVLDNKEELQFYKRNTKEPFKLKKYNTKNVLESECVENNIKNVLEAKCIENNIKKKLFVRSEVQAKCCLKNKIFLNHV